MSDTTPLVIAIDSSQVEAGKRSLADLSEQGKRTEASINKFSKATQDQKNALSDLLGKIDPTVAALGRLDNLQKELINNKNKGFIDADTFTQYNSALEASRTNLTRFTEVQNGTTKSSKELAFALRGVPAQFTDIAVSLQGGQKPLTVLLQQGGQLKDLFGGIGPAARALGGYVAGLISPFTLAAGAALGLGAAYAAGANESTRINTALITTGNIAGGTVGQFTDLATQVGKATGQYGAARDAIQALTASGLIAGSQIPDALRGVVDGAELTGKSVKELVKDFEKLANDPLKGIVELNKTQNFLTADIYKQIEALAKQGKTQEAANLAQKTYADTLESRKNEVVSNLGLFERAWRGVKEESGFALDNILKIGRVGTPIEQVAQAKFDVQRLQTGGFRGAGKGTADEIADAQAKLDNLQRDIASNEARAAAKGLRATSNKAQVDALDFLNKASLNSANLSKKDARTAAIEKINQEFAPSLEAFKNDTVEYAKAVKLRDQAIANVNDKADAPSLRKEQSAALKALNEQRKLAIDAIKEEIDNDLIASDVAGKQYADSITEKARVQKEYTAALENSLKSSVDLAQKEQDRVDALQRQIDVFGLSEQAVSSLEAAKLLDAAATYEQSIALVRLNGGTEETINFIYAEIDAIKAKANAIKQFGIKTTELDTLKEAKKSAEELKKVNEKIADDFSKSLTDAIFRGFESGKSFAKNFRDTLINTFKTLVLQPLIKFAVDSTGITGILGSLGGIFSGKASAASSIAGSSSGGLSSLLGGGKSLFDLISSGNNSIVSGIESLGSIIANGNGGILDKIGGFLGQNASGISSALPYASALLQLSTGNIAGAALTAVGTYFGGPIGGAIGGLVGSLFGGREKGKGDRTNGSFSNGKFTSLAEFSGDKGGSLGAGPSLTALSKALTENLGNYLKNFGINPSITTDLSFGSKKGNGHTDLSGSIDGAGFGSYISGDFQAGVANVLTVGFVNALKASKLPAGIKSLFDGISDKTQLDSLIKSTITLQQSQKDLAARYNLTVDAAAKVAKASGLAGDALTGFVDKLAAVSSSGKTIGSTLVASRDVLETQLNKVFGDIVRTAVTKQVTSQLAFGGNANSSNGLFGGNTAGNGSSGLSSFLGKSEQQFRTVTSNVTSYIDTLISKSIKLPVSLQAYDDLLKSINTTTTAGRKQFADVFNLRESFIAFTATLDSLKTGVKGATFGLRSPAEQASLLSVELNAMFAKLGVTVPKTAKDLLKIGDSIDFTTKLGLDLAAAFPGLVDAFDKTKASIDAITASVTRADTSFATLVDQQRYDGVSKNFNTQFAADYTSNLEAGRIVNGRATDSGATNQELVDEVKMLRAGIEAIAISNSRLVKYEAKKDLIAGVA